MCTLLPDTSSYAHLLGCLTTAELSCPQHNSRGLLFYHGPCDGGLWMGIVPPELFKQWLFLFLCVLFTFLCVGVCVLTHMYVPRHTLESTQSCSGACIHSCTILSYVSFGHLQKITQFQALTMFTFRQNYQCAFIKILRTFSAS